MVPYKEIHSRSGHLLSRVDKLLVFDFFWVPFCSMDPPGGSGLPLVAYTDEDQIFNRQHEKYRGPIAAMGKYLSNLWKRVGAGLPDGASIASTPLLACSLVRCSNDFGRLGWPRW